MKNTKDDGVKTYPCNPGPGFDAKEPEPKTDQAGPQIDAGLVSAACLGRIETPFEQQDKRIGILENQKNLNEVRLVDLENAAKHMNNGLREAAEVIRGLRTAAAAQGDVIKSLNTAVELHSQQVIKLKGECRERDKRAGVLVGAVADLTKAVKAHLMSHS